MHLARTSITTNSSAKAISKSSCLDSFKCLIVLCFSALQTVKIVKTFSIEQASICLYNWQLWDKKAFFSKYFASNNSVPPSLEEEIIEGNSANTAFSLFI